MVWLGIGVIHSNAQTDSVNFVSATWKSKKVDKGIVLKQCLFQGNLYNSNQHISILEVREGKRTEFRLGYEVKTLKLTSEFGQSAGAIAALNGTFFDMKEGGSVDFIKANGQVINENRLSKEKRGVHQQAALLIDHGKLSIAKWNGLENWEQTLTADEIMNSGPLLLFNSKAERIDSSSFAVTRHPRTVVAVTAGRVLLITIDGRHENAAGMNLFELQRIMQWLKVQDALNLDGGGSTTLWIHNQPDNGVVNYPSDNKLWDHLGERKVANVVLLKKRK